MKCESMLTVIWNNFARIKFHFYQITYAKRVKAHYRGATLGTFTTCIYNIFLQKVLHLILGFTFGVWA